MGPLRVRGASVTDDIRVVTTTGRVALRCVHCDEPIPPDTMVHFLGPRRVAHVGCDLRARGLIR